MRATRLQPRHEAVLRDLLEQDPVANLFLLDRLDETGLPRALTQHLWLGALPDDSDDLVSVVYASLPTATQPATTTVAWGDPEGCELLGKWLAMRRGTRMIVGPRAASDHIWKGLGRVPYLTRFDQRLYVCEEPAGGDLLPIERATLADLESVRVMHARMLEEDLGVRARDIDEHSHRAQVRKRIALGKSWVVRGDDCLTFSIDVGSFGPRGSQVGGTFVPAQHRGKGVATRAMRALCLELLKEVPFVTLHVNEANLPAVRCYERAGFRRANPFRLMVL